MRITLSHVKSLRAKRLAEESAQPGRTTHPKTNTFTDASGVSANDERARRDLLRGGRKLGKLKDEDLPRLFRYRRDARDLKRTYQLVRRLMKLLEVEFGNS